jgi:hypothetical protein
MRGVVLAAAISAVALAASADSITTADNLVVKGRTDHLDQKELVLVASFPSKKGVETKTVSIPRGNVVRIEFNDDDFNPGGPPAIGGRPRSEKKAQNPAGTKDIVVSDGGHQDRCQTPVTYDGGKVHCDTQEIDKDSVIRIFLGPR